MLHGLDVGELGDGHEFNFVVGCLASHEICAGIATDPMDPREKFAAQKLFVLVRILSRRPAVPDSADHSDILRFVAPPLRRAPAIHRRTQWPVRSTVFPLKFSVLRSLDES